jgi:MFS family permease
MAPLIKNIIAPIISLIIMTLGNGLFTTYVSVRLKLAHQPTEIIGFMIAVYFAGFVIGSIRINRLIERIGHIRSFACFASLITVATMVQGMFPLIWVWMVMRFLTGLLTAGLFITIESWLLAQSSIKTKGKILSVYMLTFYAAQAAGQFLLDIADPYSIIPFAITIILASFSIVPICMTRATAPIMQEPSYLHIFHLLKISPVGVIGCVIAGLILGSIYGLLPTYSQDFGMSIKEVAMVMGTTIFGGLLLQWPIGFISDHIDRRKVLFTICFLTTILSIIIASITNTGIYFLVLSLIFGGFSFTLYPLSICHASDLLDYKDIVSATAALSLAYGVGAILGPIMASYMMKYLGPNGLFYFFAIVSFILGLYTTIKTFRVAPVPVEEKVTYRNIPRTTPIAGELNPESEEKENEEETEKK